MSLVNITDLSIAFGDNKLLDHATLSIDAGQRLGLIGRNGEGKSTLLNILDGEFPADEGDIRYSPGMRIARLEQAPETGNTLTVFAEVAGGLGEAGNWVAQYHAVTANSNGEIDLSAMADLQSKLDSCDGWNIQANVNKTLSRLSLDPDMKVSELSGGWQRRVSLARALVKEPDLLLLDEPTNHLDVEAIIWLEKQIKNFRGAVLFVTHDREFLQNVATDIVELDRGKLVLWPGKYSDYIRRKAAALEQEERQNAVFDKKLAQEEVWIRQGIKARRTRNEGRVRALQKLRTEHAERRNRKGNVKISVDAGQQSGKIVIEAENLGMQYADNNIFRDFSTRIIRGDRIGLIGPNGVGKTTLLKALLKQIDPTAGTVHHGTKLEVAYFDQQRDQIDPNKTIVDEIGQGRDQITINGRDKHVISYLSDFLFSPARSRSPIKSLSGGERARVLLAKIFSKPTNMLVMDEPTNDLDIETLELLEELLLQFEGTLLLVSHDRQFLDNVVTSTFSFEGNGIINEYVGGYSDWLRQTSESNRPNSQSKTTPASSAPPAFKNEQPKKKKLNYNQQRELEKLPQQIDALESEQAQLTESISDSGFYSRPQDEVTQTLNKMQQISEELEKLYEKWSELEG